jgi:hypothetical protein
MYDLSGPSQLLFAFFAAMAEAERENIRESALVHLGRRGIIDLRSRLIR